MHLFAYDTLKFPEVWDRIVGRDFTAMPATVAGFTVRRVVNDVYPVMIRGEQADSVTGLVYHDLDATTLSHLDAYESDLYDRIPVASQLTTVQPIECQAYVLPPRNSRFASTEPWNAAEFAARWLADYMRRLDEPKR